MSYDSVKTYLVLASVGWIFTGIHESHSPHLLRRVTLLCLPRARGFDSRNENPILESNAIHI
jgi:hypothetical protein